MVFQALNTRATRRLHRKLKQTYSRIYQTEHFACSFLSSGRSFKENRQTRGVHNTVYMSIPLRNPAQKYTDNHPGKPTTLFGNRSVITESPHQRQHVLSFTPNILHLKLDMFASFHFWQISSCICCECLDVFLGCSSILLSSFFVWLYLGCLHKMWSCLVVFAGVQANKYPQKTLI